MLKKGTDTPHYSKREARQWHLDALLAMLERATMDEYGVKSRIKARKILLAGGLPEERNLDEQLMFFIGLIQFEVMRINGGTVGEAGDWCRRRLQTKPARSQRA